MGERSTGDRILNVNVGVLGHVDSGKTSLVAALSTTLSTAALDKHPQSKERGITLDLGFSSFTIPAPQYIQSAGYTQLQFTLVDCPGHASLLHTIIGGAQIIDSMILVVDVMRGIQPQTAECLVVGELTTDHLIVVLNKIDLIPEEKREKYIKKAQKMIKTTLLSTSFKSSPIIALSAKTAAASSEEQDKKGIEDLVQQLAATAQPIRPGLDLPFITYVDHCFAVKGQGTVMTGTVIQGKASIGDEISLPELGETRKIKSMQVFRKPVTSCESRDRVGICVTNLDPGLIERGLACAPGALPTFQSAIARIQKVRFFQGSVRSHTKVHILIGHNTVMARVLLFTLPSSGVNGANTINSLRNLTINDTNSFDSGKEYLYLPELPSLLDNNPNEVEDDNSIKQKQNHQQQQVEATYWALLHFDRPITAAPGALLVAAKLDAELSSATCRISFSGRTCLVDNAEVLPKLLLYQTKERPASIERIEEGRCVAVCKGIFRQDTEITSRNIGVRVIGPRGERGSIIGSFGKSGKFKVEFPEGLSPDIVLPATVSCVFKHYMSTAA